MPKATFFIPGWVIENHPDAVYPIVCAGHEIGAHGYLHERPDTLSLEEEDAILDKSVAIIRELTGRSPAGFRAPAWEFSPNTLELLGKHGFLYYSNMMDSIYPYFHRRPDGSPTLVELPVHWELDDAPFFFFCRGSRGRWPPSGRSLTPGGPNSRPTTAGAASSSSPSIPSFSVRLGWICFGG